VVLSVARVVLSVAKAVLSIDGDTRTVDGDTRTIDGDTRTVDGDTRTVDMPFMKEESLEDLAESPQHRKVVKAVIKHEIQTLVGTRIVMMRYTHSEDVVYE
jgi:hypothetical protein